MKGLFPTIALIGMAFVHNASAALILFPGTGAAITDNGAGDLNPGANFITVAGAPTPNPNIEFTGDLTGIRVGNFVQWIVTNGAFQNLTGVNQSYNGALAEFDYGAGILAGNGALEVELGGSWTSPFASNGFDFLSVQGAATTFSNNSPRADVGPLAINQPSGLVFNTGDRNNGVYNGAAGFLTATTVIELSANAQWNLPTSIDVTATVPEPSTVALVGVAGLIGGVSLYRRRKARTA